MCNPVYIGIDDAKEQLFCCTPDEKIRSFDKTDCGFSKLIEHCAEFGDPEQLFFVMESTSNYSKFTAVNLLKRAPVRVAIVSPGRVKGFKQSMQSRSKNDRIDALAVYRFAVAIQPREWVPDPPVIESIGAVSLVLDGIIANIGNMRNRLEKLQSVASPDKRAVARMEKLIRRDQKEKLKIEAEIDALVESDEEIARHAELMQGIKGVGKGVSTVILILCYREMLTLSLRQLLAFCGLSPRENESGKFKGRVTMSRLGDSRIRRILYMMAMGMVREHGIMHGYYLKQKKRGKKGKMILVNVMRKALYLIQAIVKSGKPFDPEMFANPS